MAINTCWLFNAVQYWLEMRPTKTPVSIFCFQPKTPRPECPGARCQEVWSWKRHRFAFVHPKVFQDSQANAVAVNSHVQCSFVLVWPLIYPCLCKDASRIVQKSAGSPSLWPQALHPWPVRLARRPSDALLAPRD